MTADNRLQLVDEDCCEVFEAAWLNGQRREIDECLPAPASPRFLPTLEELVCIRMELQWKAVRRSRERTTIAGTAVTVAAVAPTPVENYLQQFPQLSESEIHFRLIRQEFLIRRKCGDHVTAAEYSQRFPEKPVEELLGTENLATVDGLYESTHNSEPIVLPQIPGYEFQYQLGAGGMGQVFLANQTAADRLVAVKFIRLDRLQTAAESDRSEILDRFRTEAQATARLEHPHVVSIYEVDVDDSRQPWFSMQFVDGTTLQRELAAGPLPPRQCAEYTRQIASAIGAAHSQGILHRDLKPQNIFVQRDDGRLLVGDFGLAKLASNDAQQTSADRILGTPAYMSPEQIRDASQVTAATDIWSIGTILYRMLTGRPPFQSASVMETLRQVTDHQPVAPRDINPQLDRDIDTICMKCLQKDPTQRYTSVAALQQDIDHYLAGRAIVARPVGRVELAVRWCRRNPLPAVMLLLTVMATATAIAGLTLGYVTASAALQESDQSHAMARATVNDLLTEVSETMLFDRPGLQPLRRRLQRKALSYYRQFVRTGRNTPDIQQELAEVWYRIGRIERELGHLPLAQEAFGNSLGPLSAVYQQNDSTSALLALSNTLNGLGGLMIDQQDWLSASSYLRQARDHREELVQREPDNSEFARLHANTIMNLGAVARNEGDYRRAYDFFQTAREQQEALLQRADVPDGTGVLIRRDLGKACYNQANAAFDVNHEDVTSLLDEHLQRATDIFRELCDEFPDNYGDRRRLILCQQLLAETTPDRTAALTAIESALAAMQTLINQNPAVPGLVTEWQQLTLARADVLLDLQEYESALAVLDTAGARTDGDSRVRLIMRCEAALLCYQLRRDDAAPRLAAAKDELRLPLANSAEDEELQQLSADVTAAREALSP